MDFLRKIKGFLKNKLNMTDLLVAVITEEQQSGSRTTAPIPINIAVGGR